MKTKLLKDIRTQAYRNLSQISPKLYITYINGLEHKWYVEDGTTFTLDNFIQESVLSEIYRIRSLKRNWCLIHKTMTFAFITAFSLLIAYITFLCFILITLKP